MYETSNNKKQTIKCGNQRGAIGSTIFKPTI